MITVVFDRPLTLAGLYNNVDEEWACPSVEDAEMAVLYENAVRLDEGWYQQNSSCEV